MKVRASVKKRSPQCKLVKRKEYFTVSIRRILNLNKDKDKKYNFRILSL